MNKFLGASLIFCLVTPGVYGAEMLPKSPYMSLYNRLDDLRNKADEARRKETSLENRVLTGVSVAVMGLGGMKLFSGAAEKQADAAADADMRAYTATFVCDYGAGRNIRYDTQNVELPGGNMLMPLVMEYKSLALDLQQRKQALGLSPGIESELIITHD